MITLIMLVVMTLSAIALIRSTDTTNLIAGNVAFQQGATNSAQQGIQAGLNDIATLNTGTTLWAVIPNAKWYSPVNCNQTQPTIEWWAWWKTINSTHTCTSSSGATTTLIPNALPTDASGNTVSYLIERLCNAQGDPSNAAAVCEAKAIEDTYSSLPYWYPVQYYRITAYVSGSKGTQSLVQAIVSQ